MNIYFIAIVVLYALILLGVSIIDIKKVHTWTDYAVAGRNQNLFAVTMTLLATMIGASTTIGLTDTVYRIGFPAIWWLTFGSIGLILQSLLIGYKISHFPTNNLLFSLYLIMFVRIN